MKLIPINDNLFNGDCGLWYDVVKNGNSLIHCVCPYSICKSFEEAIEYYWFKLYKKEHIPQLVQYHKFPKLALEQLSLVC